MTGNMETKPESREFTVTPAGIQRVCFRITGNPHLTPRWPFGCVTEGLSTTHPERHKVSFSGRSMSSIKRDVKKKNPPPPGRREVFCLEGWGVQSLARSP